MDGAGSPVAVQLNDTISFMLVALILAGPEEMTGGAVTSKQIEYCHEWLCMYRRIIIYNYSQTQAYLSLAGRVKPLAQSSILF